jgi:endonuclease/exonuclease/phosphatase (EEP) superfamily protein YafD
VVDLRKGSREPQRERQERERERERENSPAQIDLTRSHFSIHREPFSRIRGLCKVASQMPDAKKSPLHVHFHQPFNVIRLTIACLLAVAVLQGAPDRLSNHDAPIFFSVEECIHGMSLQTATAPSHHELKDEFELICWNIEKGNNPGWKQELKAMAANTQLVLLQEAIFVEEMKQPREKPLFWSFAPGYETNAHSSGVMTVSRMQPSFFCSLEATEPWLRSPKKTSIVQFPLGHDGNSLLLVNMHAINFTFGIKAFAKQLNEVGHILGAHTGPIVFSGDLNTWTQARKDVLSPFISKFNLTEVGFEPDHRSHKMGHPVDYIFTRGLEVKQSRVVEVDTSDHNPLIVTLALLSDESI